MLVVSDSSTLILLAKSGLLDHALVYFSGIAIPSEVDAEIAEGLRGGHEDALLIRERIRQGKIRVVAATLESTLRLQNEYGLGVGEAASIAAYLRLNADLFGVDDGKAIRVCRLLGVRFFTALSLSIHLSKTIPFPKGDAIACVGELEKHGRYTKDEILLALDEIGGVRK